MSTNANLYSVNAQTVRHNLPTPQQSQSYLLYATSFGHEFIKSDYLLDRFDIDLYMVNYVVRGRAFMRHGGQNHVLNAGDLTFLHLGEHNIFRPETEELEIYFFHILGGKVKEALENFTAERKSYVMHGFPEEVVKQTFDALLGAMDEPDLHFTAHHALDGLLTEILRRAAREQHGERYPELVERIFLEIRNRNAETIRDLAALLGYSPVYLEQYFKKHTGMTLRGAILQFKFDLAAHMLLTTDLSVEEIAHKVGYADAKGLIRLFQTAGGTTPNAFRKQKGR